MPRRHSSRSRATRARSGSPPAHRVANRDMSWLEPVHTGQAPDGRAASVASTMARMAASSSGALMNGKLKARCSSSCPLP